MSVLSYLLDGFKVYLVCGVYHTFEIVFSFSQVMEQCLQIYVCSSYAVDKDFHSLTSFGFRVSLRSLNLCTYIIQHLLNNVK